MINKIEIENFLSIRNKQTLDLTVDGKVRIGSDRLEDCWPGSKTRVPKVVSIFGANGSGKSNVLRALSFMIWFIRTSFNNPPNQRLPFEPFQDLESARSPTRLKLWTSARENLVNTNASEELFCDYCYELTISSQDQQVENEGIFYWPNETGRRTRVIERFVDGTIKAAKPLKLTTDRKVLEKILRPNASVISTLAQLNNPFANQIFQSTNQVISNILHERNEVQDNLILRHYVDNPALVKSFNREIKRIDFGVRSLNVVNSSEGPFVEFSHEGLDIPLAFVSESHGTRQFLKHFPIISTVLENGGIFIADELDAAIHPMIMSEILGWFYDPKRNPFGAQLWMSCHNASLLENLTKNEIVFCEKDWQGRTEFFGLDEVEGVRRDENYYRKYLGGAYGAVPRFG